jgi:PEP-CTERM motif
MVHLPGHVAQYVGRKAMSMTDARFPILLSVLGCLCALPAAADTPFFSTGNPDGKIATASRPASAGKFEIESADDFVLTHSTSITSATFTGLLTGTNPTVGEVRVEIYRVFPADSGVPSGHVPTRANSPSDVEFADRDNAPAPGNLTFTITNVSNTFSAFNSVQPGGIHRAPIQTTGGNGVITGEEVQFDVTFTTPFTLPADHYFFVPQVEVTDPSDGNFFWLSALRPITGGTGPFVGDLQEWTRDAMLDPDWLRVGTDIVGGATPPTFNAAFSLSGSAVPEPSTWAMMLLGFLGVGFAGYRQSRNRPAGLSPV